MKKLMTITLLFVAVLWSAVPSAYAATFSAAKTVSATVVPNLGLQIVMKKNDFAGAIIPGNTMDFGNLVDIGTGTLRSSSTSNTGTGAVFMTITPIVQGGLTYSITSTGTAMTGTAGTLPAGALVVKAVYNTLDQTPSGATQPTGSTTPTSGGASWTLPNTLYTSGPTAAIRTVSAFFSITDDPLAGSTAGVPLSQNAGTYTSTVTITVTA